jgi:hypothetical protein
MNTRARFDAQDYLARSRAEAMDDTDFQQFFVASSTMECWDSSPAIWKRRWGGSVVGRAYVARDHAGGAKRLYEDYFAPKPVFNAKMFRRRFRMRKHLFLRVVKKVSEINDFFQEKPDCRGKCLSTLQKATAAFRQLAYGMPSDAVDEYTRIGAETARVALHEFVDAVVEGFGEEYLRAPTVDDTKRLLEVNAASGFPGMLGSIDCNNWKWKNCPSGVEGMYKGGKDKSVVLEAVASHDLWIWHCFFGCPGSMNDINVLQRSPLMDAIENGTMHFVEFELNGKIYNLPYWLADGIYPNYPVFAKSMKDPIGAAKQFYSEMQESLRKGIERAFGVLQARFAIVKVAARQWRKATMTTIMKCCIILHNMIVEDERDDNAIMNDTRFHPRFDNSKKRQ